MERIRNKLTPFLTLANIAAQDDPQDKAILLETAKLASGLSQDILDHLDDLQEMLMSFEERLEKYEVPEWAIGMKPESPGPDTNGN